MGILDRIRTVLKSNINALISKAEDPEKMLNQLIMDMNEQLLEAKKQVAMSIADEKKLERQAAGEQGARREEWEGKAMLAVKAGKDDLAKEALRAQAGVRRLRRRLPEGVRQPSTPPWSSSRTRCASSQAKIEEASRKKNLLVARAKRAEAQKQIQQTMGSLSATSSFDTFDRMAQKVDQIEAEAEALKELGAVTADQKLEDKFKELECSGASADKLLEDLKAKMGQIENKEKK